MRVQTYTALGIAWLMSAHLLLSQTAGSGPKPHRFQAVWGPYEWRPAAPISTENSTRLEKLMADGQLYLSLKDAIALALENNLDIATGRYGPRLAESDIRLAQGGGLPRGLNYVIAETPPGTGGPAGPLLIRLTAGSTPTSVTNTDFSNLALITQQQNNLSVLGTTPFSSGPALPLYDPALTGQLTWQHQTNAQLTSNVTGTNWLVNQGVTSAFALTQGFSSGTQLSATFDSTGATTNSPRYTFNPYRNATLGLTVTQPLLRGFGTGVNRRFLHIAKNNRRVADLVFRQQVIDTVAGVIRLYIDLVSLNEDAKVKGETLESARRLYEDNQNKVTQGTLAPIELTRAQAQVAACQQALIASAGLVRQQELILKTQLNRTGLKEPAFRQAHIVVVDPVSLPSQEPDGREEDLLAEAMANRPDLKQAGLQIESAELSLKGSRNALLPQVNLVGFALNSGLAGQPNTLPVPGGTADIGLAPGGAPLSGVGGSGTVLNQIFTRSYPTYGGGVQINLPFRNRIAEANASRDQLQLRQGQLQRQRLENQVRLEVANAVEAVRQAKASYKAAVEARTLQQQSVEIEQEKFQVGLSTPFLVIQYLSFLTQARSTEVVAKGEYAKAQTSLERAIGKTLEVQGISIDEAYEGRASRPPATTPPLNPR